MCLLGVVLVGLVGAVLLGVVLLGVVLVALHPLNQQKKICNPSKKSKKNRQQETMDQRKNQHKNRGATRRSARIQGKSAKTGGTKRIVEMDFDKSL